MTDDEPLTDKEAIVALRDVLEYVLSCYGHLDYPPGYLDPVKMARDILDQTEPDR